MVALRFELDMILFEDGELAGSDIDGYAAGLQTRKPAAQFIAEQIRLALAEGRDVKSLLDALVKHRPRPNDFLAYSKWLYAMQCLSWAHHERGWEERLRSLENRPVMPRFYRRDHGGNS